MKSENNPFPHSTLPVSMTTQSSPIYSTLASDPDLREIIRLFVEEMPERIRTLETKLTTEHWSELAQTAHQLKGAAGSHGFMELSTAAATLDATIKANADKEKIAATTASLVTFCRRVTAEPAPGEELL